MNEVLVITILVTESLRGSVSAFKGSNIQYLCALIKAIVQLINRCMYMSM